MPLQAAPPPTCLPMIYHFIFTRPGGHDDFRPIDGDDRIRHARAARHSATISEKPEARRFLRSFRVAASLSPESPWLQVYVPSRRQLLSTSAYFIYTPDILRHSALAGLWLHLLGVDVATLICEVSPLPLQPPLPHFVAALIYEAPE